MPRAISLLVFPSRLFPAHWALFVPSLESPGSGTFLNARGNSLSGFTIEIEREYVLADAPMHKMVLLGEVADDFIVDFDGLGEVQGARNCLEEVVLSVGALGGSLRKVAVEGVEEAPGKRVKIENCQTWLRELVIKLVKNGVLHEEAVGIVDQAPKH